MTGRAFVGISIPHCPGQTAGWEDINSQLGLVQPFKGISLQLLAQTERRKDIYSRHLRR